MNVDVIDSDVLIVGGGLAGTFAAIKAKEVGANKVVIVSKGKLGKDSISTFAAGVFGIVSPKDDKDAEFRTRALKDYWAGGLYHEDWLSILLNDNYDRVLEMDKWGVEWEKTPDGEFERKRARRGRLVGMFHGPQMMEAMARKAISDGVKAIPRVMMTDFLTENGNTGERVTGAVGFDSRTGEFKVFKAKATVLAAGALAFKGREPGHAFQTGEAYAMAYRAGAELGEFEIGLIHYTSSTQFPTQGMNMFVALGAHFINSEGERFMLEYEPELGDQATLSRIAEASAMEVRAGRGPIYLDATHWTVEDVRKFRIACPIPARALERAGVMVGDKMLKRLEFAGGISNFTSQGGGVKANTKCETSLPGLYACGDAMLRSRVATGLPTAAVSGARAGIFAAEYAKEAKESRIDNEQVERHRKFALAPLERKYGIDPEYIIIKLQQALFPYEVSVISRRDRLERAIQEIEKIRDEEIPLLYASDAHFLRLANEIKSMVLFTEMYLRSRLLRTESRDSCLREDYPYIDNVNWLKFTRLKQDDGAMKLWTEDMAIDKYQIKPKREKRLHPVFEVANKRGIRWG